MIMIKSWSYPYKNREVNGMSVSAIAKANGVPRSTVYAKLKTEKEHKNDPS